MNSSRFASRRRWLRATAAACGATVVGCLREGRLKRPIEYTPKQRPDWPVAAAEAVGLTATDLRRAYEFVFDPEQVLNIRSLLVARRGRLVAEGYVADAHDIDRLGALMSATKSFTSVLAAIAIEEKLLPSLDVRVGDVFSELRASRRYADLTLRDALTMRAGIDYANEDFSLDMEWGDHADSVAFLLSKPKAAPPGRVFHYTDASLHLAGAIVAQHVGMPLERFASRVLFTPLGIERYRWLKHSDGRNYGAYGLFLTPRAFLRFGQAMLDALAEQEADIPSRPRIVGRDRLLPAVSFQVEPDFGDGFGYGLAWWITPERDGFCAWGHGGQMCLCLPDEQLVIVVTAEPNSDEGSVSVSGHELLHIKRLLLGRD